jgi:hypothetical protein
LSFNIYVRSNHGIWGTTKTKICLIGMEDFVEKNKFLIAYKHLEKFPIVLEGRLLSMNIPPWKDKCSYTYFLRLGEISCVGQSSSPHCIPHYVFETMGSFHLVPRYVFQHAPLSMEERLWAAMWPRITIWDLPKSLCLLTALASSNQKMFHEGSHKMNSFTVHSNTWWTFLKMWDQMKTTHCSIW